MKCEKLIHGHHRTGRIVKDKNTGLPALVGRTENHPYRCDRPAVKFAVSGKSFTAFATLCKMHEEAAKREGFELKVVPE